MVNVSFYQLTRLRLAAVLPVLIAKLRGANWRVLILCNDEQHMKGIDDMLWRSPKGSFLPHDILGGEHDQLQPVLLSCGPAVAPDRQALVMLGGASATVEEFRAFERVLIIFDSRMGAETAEARRQWKWCSESGLDAVLWAEEGSSWVRKVDTRQAG